MARTFFSQNLTHFLSKFKVKLFLYMIKLLLNVSQAQFRSGFISSWRYYLILRYIMSSYFIFLRDLFKLVDCNQKYPIQNVPRLGFLKNFIANPNIQVGDFTYYDDPDGIDNFETKNVLYHFDFVGDKLIIGKFCQLATGVRFIMNGANHGLQGFTTYPFKIFGKPFENLSRLSDKKGNTVIGNDVWIGYDVTIMPGVMVGDGAIIASKSVVTKNVESYSIVGGNPAQHIRHRFSKEIIDLLLELKWWDWDINTIAKYANVILDDDLKALTNLKLLNKSNNI